MRMMLLVAMRDDTFETGLGNDLIDGGSGTDTVKLSDNYSNYQITHDLTQDKFIKGSNENKTVANVEQFNLMMCHILAMN